MRQTLKNYGYTLNQIPLLCDNESAIKIAYNPCEHSRTKHIDIRHHFLRDHVIKGDIIYLTYWNQWPISRYFHQAPWWVKISWTLKWTKHHWFSECGLGCCISNLKLATTCWACFFVKILFMLKFMHVLWSYCFQAICMFYFSKLVHLWPLYVLLLAYTPNPSTIKLSRGF
jgi:hypothetical protein